MVESKAQMNKQEIISLVADPDFQREVRGLMEKGLSETLSFVAVVLSAIIALGALTIASVQLRKQLQEWEKGRGALSAQLKLASNELSIVAQGIR
jgi:hypothetical protein